MPQFQDPLKLQELFSAEHHYNVAGDTVALANSAHDAIVKKYGGGVLSSHNNMMLLSLFEAWDKTDEVIAFELFPDEVVLTIGEERINPELNAQGLRWVTEVFTLTVGEQPSTAIVNGVYTARSALANGGELTLTAVAIPDDNEHPVFPAQVVITPPQVVEA